MRASCLFYDIHKTVTNDRPLNIVRLFIVHLSPESNNYQPMFDHLNSGSSGILSILFKHNEYSFGPTAKNVHRRGVYDFRSRQKWYTGSE
jgi:hypothetical protein